MPQPGRGRGRGGGGRGVGRAARRKRKGRRRRKEQAVIDADLGFSMADIVEAQSSEALQKAVVAEMMLTALTPPEAAADPKAAAEGKDEGDTKAKNKAYVRLGKALVVGVHRMMDWNASAAVRIAEDAVACFASGKMQMRGEKKGFEVLPEIRKSFVEEFAASFKPKASAAAKSMDYSKIGRIVRISFAFLRGALPEFYTLISEEFPSFFTGQCQLLEALKHSPSKVVTKVSAWIAHTILGAEEKLSKTLKEKYLGIAEKKGNKRSMTLRMMQEVALKPKFRQKLAPQALPLKKWMISSLMDSLSSAASSSSEKKGGEGMSEFSLLPYQYVIEAIGEGEFAKSVWPPIMQNLKKLPAETMRILAEYLRYNRLDLSKYITDLSPFLVSGLQNEAPWRRHNALICVKRLASSCIDAKELIKFTTTLGESLSAKKGSPIIVDPATRITMVMALRVIGESKKLSEKALKDLSTRPILDLLSLMKKESHDDVRVIALDTIVGWTIHRKVVPAKVLARFQKGIAANSKSMDRNIVSHYMQQLLRLAKNGLFLPFEDEKTAKAHVDKLLTVATEGIGISARRDQAVGAFGILFHPDLHGEYRKIFAKIEDPAALLAKHQTVFRGEKSLLNDREAVLSSSETGALSHLSLGRHLIENHWDMIKPQPFEDLPPSSDNDASQDTKTSKPDAKKRKGKKGNKRGAAPRGGTKAKNPPDEKKKEKVKWTDEEIESKALRSPYSAFLKGMLCLFLHRSSIVRRTAAKTFEDIIKSSVLVLDALLPCLLTLLDELHRSPPKPRAELLMGDDENDGGLSSSSGGNGESSEGIATLSSSGGPPSAVLSTTPRASGEGRFQMCARMIGALGAQCLRSQRGVLSISLAAHHPLFSIAQYRRRSGIPRLRPAAWKILLGRWKREGGLETAKEEKKQEKKKGKESASSSLSLVSAYAFNSLVQQEGKGDALSKQLLSADGLRSRSYCQRKAWIMLAATITKTCPSITEKLLLPPILKLLQSCKDVDALTPYEIAVVCAGEGGACGEKEGEEEDERKVAVIDEARYGRRKRLQAKQINTANVRSRNKAYSAEEERWAREEMQKEALSKFEEEKMKVLEDDRRRQADLRAKIRWQVVAPIASALDLLATICKAAPEWAHQRVVPSFSQPVQARIADPVIGTSAAFATHAFAYALRGQSLDNLRAKATGFSNNTLDLVTSSVCRVALYLVDKKKMKKKKSRGGRSKEEKKGDEKEEEDNAIDVDTDAVLFDMKRFYAELEEDSLIARCIRRICSLVKGETINVQAETRSAANNGDDEGYDDDEEEEEEEGKEDTPPQRLGLSAPTMIFVGNLLRLAATALEYSDLKRSEWEEEKKIREAKQAEAEAKAAALGEKKAKSGGNRGEKYLSRMSSKNKNHGEKLLPKPLGLTAYIDIVVAHANERLLVENKKKSSSSSERKVDDARQRTVAVSRYPVGMLSELLLRLMACDNKTAQANKKRIRNSFFKVSQALAEHELPVLLGDLGVLSDNVDARLAAHNAMVLQSTAFLSASLCGGGARKGKKKIGSLGYVSRVLIGRFDSDPFVKRAATRVWETNNLSVKENYADEAYGLIDLLGHSTHNVRAAAASAIAEAMSQHTKTTVESTFDALIAIFIASPDEHVEAQEDLPTYGGMGEGGAVAFDNDDEATTFIDNSPTRHAVCLAIREAAPYVISDSRSSSTGRQVLQKLMQFFIDHAFKDAVSYVWSAALDAALTLIEKYGDRHTDVMLPMLEAHLALSGSGAAAEKKKGKSSKATSSSAEEKAMMDRVREGVVICLGNAARFIPSESPKVSDVISLLIEMLQTPSYDVQVAVSECLVHLMPAVNDDDAKTYIDQCLAGLKGSSYGVRKGAAFGLGGIVKGLGMEMLKEHGILAELTKMVTNKGSYKVREGALFAYERLFCSLGYKFEPCLIHILPHLLRSFGDNSKDVRRATQDASRQIMANITSSGMKIVMPLVLRSLNDKKWRTKLESIGLLGSMAHCSTDQLSQALPTIIPRLLQSLSDPHEEVQRGARRALKQVGSVVSNPELYTSLPAILAALAKPAKTEAALQRLIDTSFVHAVDAASLALLIPIIWRGLRDRKGKVKQMAAQITGSICSLVSDTNDLLPYSARLIDLIKGIVADVHPTVRKVAAMALGSLYKGLGEDEMPGIMQQMIERLRAPESAVERSGAALAVAYLLVVMGSESVTKFLPTILEGVRDETPAVREGFANLFITLPDAFGIKFVPFLPNVLRSVLELLDDQSVEVRSLALQAGHSIAESYSETKQIESVLPALEEGLKLGEWRCRMGACHIMGTYLCNLAGAAGQVVVPQTESEELVDNTDEQKEGAKITTTRVHMIMANKIGLPRRDRILAAIYLMRSDSIHMVANVAWRVWKAVVVNSPATLTSIFPTLINEIIASLASTDETEQHSAGEALGGIVKKMGVGVLKVVVPLLQTRLNSEEESTRQGVCLGLSEIMRSTSKKRISEYVPVLIAAVRDALCDEVESVREAAGAAFQTLHSIVGQDAIDEIVPALVKQLGANDNDIEEKEAEDGDELDEDEDEAGDDEDGDDDGYIEPELVLGGMRQILKTHSRMVLPFLVPQLMQRPISLFRAQALASLAEVLGTSFYRYIENVTRAFIEAMEREAVAGNGPRRQEFLQHAAQLNANLRQDAVHALVATLCEVIQSPRAKAHNHDKLAAVELLERFAKESKCDLVHNLESMLHAALLLFAAKEAEVLKHAVMAAANVMKLVPKNKNAEYIKQVAAILREVTHDISANQIIFELPGLNVRGALRPFIQLLTEGLMKGNENTKELAANTIGTFVSLTAPTALNPYVMLITGPLIRMASENFSEGVKVAILQTLALLLARCGPRLKAFFSALQTTFRKSLHHKSPEVREKTVEGLATMMKHNARVDNVIQDLVSQVRREEDAHVKGSLLTAIHRVMEHKSTATKVSSPLMSSLIATVGPLLSVQQSMVRTAAKKTFDTSVKYLEGEAEIKAAMAKYGGRGDDNDLSSDSEA